MIRRLDVAAIGLDWLKEVASVHTNYALQMDWHHHAGTEVICCTHGEMTYEFRDQASVTLKSGEMLVVPARVPHRLAEGFVGPSRRISYILKARAANQTHFSPFTSGDYARILSNLLARSGRACGLAPVAARLLVRLGAFLHRDSQAATGLELCELRLLIGALVLCCAQADGRSSSRQDDRILQEAVSWIERHYAEHVNIDQLLRYIGYGRTQFFRLFKGKTGLSPMDYLIQFRIRKAKELLKSGELSIRETAARVGFTDAMFFSRTFSRRIGVSPTQWAARHAGGRLTEQECTGRSDKR